ncbi:MAG: RNA-binding protein [Candidatus Wallbacteria bacterium]|nr:RNA-binding protein [Candidatus Wallbacteria bacterium]
MTTPRLYVGNLPYSTTTEDLNSMFSKHGTVKDVKVIEGKGFAFVEMNDIAEAEKAMTALNNQEINGRTLKIDEAKPQQPRTGGSYGGGNSNRTPRRY